MRRNIISGLISSIVFLILFIGIKWNLIISFALAAGVFFSSFMFLKPTLKIGSFSTDELEDGQELEKILSDAKDDLGYLRSYSSMDTNNNIEVQTEIDSLVKLGSGIINKMEQNPKLISKSRHFLTYYVDRARKIVENYDELREGYISDPKFLKIEESTIDSLKLLNQVFKSTRDDIYKSKLLELEVENDLLEKTVKMGRSLNEK